jgi:TM2 domain-containing membrane protein YozV
MAGNFCAHCGNSISSQAIACPQCGHPTANAAPQVTYAPGVDPNSLPAKSKLTAGLLGILLGGIGVHKFYMGKVGLGILYVVFCWTYVPAIIGLIEGIIYLTQTDEAFARNNNVRIQ